MMIITRVEGIYMGDLVRRMIDDLVVNELA
jgi:hypothetical protein